MHVLASAIKLAETNNNYNGCERGHCPGDVCVSRRPNRVYQPIPGYAHHRAPTPGPAPAHRRWIFPLIVTAAPRARLSALWASGGSARGTGRKRALAPLVRAPRAGSLLPRSRSPRFRETDSDGRNNGYIADNTNLAPVVHATRVDGTRVLIVPVASAVVGSVAYIGPSPALLDFSKFLDFQKKNFWDCTKLRLRFSFDNGKTTVVQHRKMVVQAHTNFTLNTGEDNF